MKSRRYEIGVGALVIGAGALFAWMSMQVSGLQVGDSVQVTAVFSDVAGLNQGASVTVAGVEIGRVEALEVDFDRARVQISLDAGAQVREDARFEIQARSVLGEKYVAVVPASQDAPLLQDGAVITDTASPLEITQLVTEMGPLIRAVDADGLASALDALSAAIEEDPERARRMLADAEVALANIREASEAAPDLVQETRATLRDVRDLSARARPVLRRGEAVIAEIEVAMEPVPAATERLPALAEEAELTMAEARQIVEALGGETERIQRILENIEEIDKWELRRLLREEGILVRLREDEVVPTD